jgi:hypothetical protein
MRMSWSRPRLGGLIAPRLAFLGLFSETVEARPERTLRGHARVQVIAREWVGRSRERTPGTRKAKKCFLRVTSDAFFECGGLHRPAGPGNLTAHGRYSVLSRVLPKTPARIALPRPDRSTCLYSHHIKSDVLQRASSFLAAIRALGTKQGVQSSGSGAQRALLDRVTTENNLAAHAFFTGYCLSESLPMSDEELAVRGMSAACAGCRNKTKSGPTANAKAGNVALDAHFSRVCPLRALPARWTPRVPGDDFSLDTPPTSSPTQRATTFDQRCHTPSCSSLALLDSATLIFFFSFRGARLGDHIGSCASGIESDESSCRVGLRRGKVTGLLCKPLRKLRFRRDGLGRVIKSNF